MRCDSQHPAFAEKANPVNQLANIHQLFRRHADSNHAQDPKTGEGSNAGGHRRTDRPISKTPNRDKCYAYA